MALKTKTEILDFIKQYNLPITPTSGVLVYTLKDPEKIGDLYIPTKYKESAIRSGEVLKGVIVSDPINCEDEPSIKKGVTVLYKAASGAALNINGHLFHTLELTDILGIEND